VRSQSFFVFYFSAMVNRGFSLWASRCPLPLRLLFFFVQLSLDAFFFLWPPLCHREGHGPVVFLGDIRDLERTDLLPTGEPRQDLTENHPFFLVGPHGSVRVSFPLTSRIYVKTSPLFDPGFFPILYLIRGSKYVFSREELRGRGLVSTPLN